MDDLIALPWGGVTTRSPKDAVCGDCRDTILFEVVRDWRLLGKPVRTWQSTYSILCPRCLPGPGQHQLKTFIRQHIGWFDIRKSTFTIDQPWDRLPIPDRVQEHERHNGKE